MKNPYWHDYYKPHVVDFDGIRWLCVEAFAILAASRSLMGKPGDEIGGTLHDTFFRMAEGWLSEAFLSIAVKVRTFEDTLAATDNKKEYDEFIAAKVDDEQLGSIGAKGVIERKNLSLREACNKIIHTKDFRPVYDNGSHGRDEDFAWGMEGTIELAGEMNGKAWDAWLNAEEFLSVCLELADLISPVEIEHQDDLEPGNLDTISA
jgi:hypothetical protein